MARRVSLIALALLASGCARPSMDWMRPGTSQAMADRDTYDCERDMRMSGPYGGYPMMRRCMMAKGYSLEKH